MDKHSVLQQKIHDRESIKKLVAFWKFSDQKIVFTNGCFDLLHYGHIDYLSKAASLGDKLVVGLNTDASTSRLKGPARPVNDEKSRLHIMASLFFVNAVILFDEPTPIGLIRIVEPDILVKGGDYRPEQIVGYEEVTRRGGEVVVLDFVPGYSTTALEKKIISGTR